jgi:hypothetical protein
MAAFEKFHVFATDKAAGLHVNALNASTDVLKVYLSNTTPSVSTHTAYAAASGGGFEEIAAGNGYTAGGEDAGNDATLSGGIITVTGVDVTITAASGTIGPFRYVGLYNSTAAGNKLIGVWDYGSEITLLDTQPFIVDFQPIIFTDQ